MKINEGQAIHKDIKIRLDTCLKILNNIDEISSDEPHLKIENINLRLAKLDKKLVLNEERIEQEVALLLDRLDISEEVLRFRTHLDYMHDILEQKEIGKKAEFLVQELNREVNTIASKSNNAQISRLSVEIKSELEKLREQLQNIE